MINRKLLIGASSFISGSITYFLLNRYSESKINSNYIKKEEIEKKENNKIIYLSNHKDYRYLSEYLYKEYSEKIKIFSYTDENVHTYNEWRYRRHREKKLSIKVIKPILSSFEITYKNMKIKIDIDVMKNSKGEYIKLLKTQDCCTREEFVSRIILTCENRDILKKSSSETIRIFYYRKDYWSLLSKLPKRPIETVYLKKGMKDIFLESVEDFFSDKTREIYLNFGIPYKCVNLIYGPPGSGKTSFIKSIASVLDCDLYVLPISKDMLDTHLVDAFSFPEDEISKKKIIVIEDIDTFFDDRKDGDKDNGITLQGFLNCLDGFTCVEGTMLFLTANKPEVLDNAFIRSCRIDHKLELTYADEYQTKEMFSIFLPNQKDRFTDFYKQIKHKEYTTAVLQEFLFYNKDCKNILEIMDKFNEILEKNEPKNFELLKHENKNFYS